MLKIHKRVQGCQKGASWDYCHNQDEVMGTCTEMEAVKMGRGDGSGHILKAESKEFLDKLHVKYEREESRMMSDFWLSNWKDGVSSRQDGKDCGEETIGCSSLEKGERSMLVIRT